MKIRSCLFCGVFAALIFIACDDNGAWAGKGSSFSSEIEFSSSSLLETASSSSIESLSSSEEAFISSSSIIMEFFSSSSAEMISSSSLVETLSSSSSDILVLSSSSADENVLIDFRDGNIYRTVKIGSQVWMAENLNYVTTTGSWCYQDGEDSLAGTNKCDIYGRLYNWATAMALNDSCNTSSCSTQLSNPHQGICPEGFHVPKDSERSALISSVGNSKNAGGFLKSTSGWNEDQNGTDDYGFSALPGGFYDLYDQAFSPAKTYGVWWGRQVRAATEAASWGVDQGIAMGPFQYSEKKFGLSLRCVKNEP